MKKMLLTMIIMILSFSACNSMPKTPGSGSSEPTPVTSKTQGNVEPYVSTAGSFLAINEIGLGPEGYVALNNFTDVPVTTKGQYLCQGSDCFALPDAVIEAGGTGKVTVGDGKGLENVIAKKATIGELKPSDGEIALFLSDQFNDPKAIIEGV